MSFSAGKFEGCRHCFGARGAAPCTASAPLARASGVVTQDTLSDVLRAVRLRGAVFFNITGSREWAAEAPPGRDLAPLLMHGVDHVIEYHAVARGSCWAAIPGGPSVQLFPGDVVMFPQGDAHVVSSTPGLRDSSDFTWFTSEKVDRYPIRLS